MQMKWSCFYYIPINCHNYKLVLIPRKQRWPIEWSVYLTLDVVQGIKFTLQACQEALIKHYPDDFNKFQLVLDRDDFVTEANIDFGLTVAEQRVVELDKVQWFV